jgi:hypothetical protein
LDLKLFFKQYFMHFWQDHTANQPNEGGCYVLLHTFDSMTADLQPASLSSAVGTNSFANASPMA